MGLQQQSIGQQTGRYAGPPVVWAIEFGEIFIPEQLASLVGQEAIEAVPANKVQVLVICLEQASLTRAFTERVSLLIWVVEECTTNPRKTRAFRPSF